MEIEAKIKLKNLSKLRASLKSAHADFEGRALEKNWLYDYPDRALTRADELLRLRQDTRVYYTYKGPRQESEYKEREELELEFPDASSAGGLLESIGFVRWFYYEKIRETWKLDDCEIVIDELPGLDIFVEVEGPTKQKIDKAVKRLKLPRKYISKTYVEMLQEHASETHKPKHEFKFSPQHESVLAADDATPE
jgi:adenylate cyclase class 2